MKYQILHGDNRDTLKTLPDNSIDAIVTDPPYGIDFLGKAWDANTGALETYQQCLRVLKPGGHILAFSAARTYHHLAVTLEAAGFEIRDQIMWIYSSGFPKSQDVGKSIERAQGKRKKLPSDNGSAIVGMGTQCSKCGKKENGSNQYKCSEDPCPLKEVLKPADNEWAGWGTALKPAHEPIALARKPMKLSIAKNCQTHGVGALNIDACRIPIEGADTRNGGADGWDRVEFGEAEPNKSDGQGYVPNDLGRFPSNVIGEIPLYQKYFYCPKVSRAERHVGFDPNSQGNIIDSEVFGKTPVCLDCGKTRNGSTKHDKCDPANIGFQERRTQRSTEVGNNHPTVKPIELMKYLIKLVTPPGGVVLDPFNGSGSTGCAAVELGYEYIGCELDANYVDIATRRIEAWYAKTNPTTYNQIFEQD
ncbi:AdoMet_MTases domain containing protein [uncultured Caudovirales phage]|uniref:AdoMet_MTases domain containing protein n=1 Tax=uncultured Caudovirales phage TaxID=2100421 RepID=A0A6J5PA08_9CAUD|nr:AdoMet_MTases domain containing protein [uncultured Caudovirales phage]